jgi:hypothetical protein
MASTAPAWTTGSTLLSGGEENLRAVKAGPGPRRRAVLGQLRNQVRRAAQLETEILERAVRPPHLLRHLQQRSDVPLSLQGHASGLRGSEQRRAGRQAGQSAAYAGAGCLHMKILDNGQDPTGQDTHAAARRERPELASVAQMGRGSERTSSRGVSTSCGVAAFNSAAARVRFLPFGSLEPSIRRTTTGALARGEGGIKNRRAPRMQTCPR